MRRRSDGVERNCVFPLAKRTFLYLKQSLASGRLSRRLLAAHSGSRRLQKAKNNGSPQRNAHLQRRCVLNLDLQLGLKRASGRASWGQFGAISGHLGPSWGHLGPSWGHLEPSWPILGPAWAILGPNWAILGHLGAILGPSWCHLGAILGSSWGHLGPSWAILGRLTRSYDRKGDMLEKCNRSHTKCSFWWPRLSQDGSKMAS